jgi:large subunit ribosomal protein L18
MKSKSEIKSSNRERRHRRIRSKIKGTIERPRLSVFKSNRYLEIQLINDDTESTIASVSTKSLKGKTMMERALEAGKTIATLAKDKKITKAVFDRGGFIFTGKVKAVADGAREGGLEF